MGNCCGSSSEEPKRKGIPLNEVIWNDDSKAIITELNVQYKSLLDAIQAIPYIRDRTNKSAQEFLSSKSFDSKWRDTYVRRAVVGNDTNAADRIHQMFKKNPVLGEICQVPMFFVMFALMTHEGHDSKSFSSLTNFLRNIVECFQKHLKNNMSDVTDDEEDNGLQTLYAWAFESLNQGTERLDCSKDELCSKIGEDNYEKIKRMGIFAENVEHTDSHRSEVAFIHKLFWEWFAANHLAEYIVSPSPVKLEGILRKIDPAEHQYVYRFACGLSPIAAEKLIKYLNGTEDGKNLAVLCMLEHPETVDEFNKTLPQLCSRTVNISNEDSLLFQKSTTHLLAIASRSEIPISTVWLTSCFSSVDLSTSSVVMKSGVSFPSLATVSELCFKEEKRALTEEDAAGILSYAATCASLESLGFDDCMLPLALKVTSSLSDLASRKIQVEWIPGTGPRYSLDLKSGKWTDTENGTVLTQEVYVQVEQEFQEYWSQS